MGSSKMNPNEHEAGLPTSLRKSNTERRYQDDKAQGRCNDLLDEPAIFEKFGWRLIENNYPYDAVFDKHHMLIPITAEHHAVTDQGFQMMLRVLEDDYDFWFVNFKHRQSIKHLFHAHLVTHKPREEMEL